MRIELPIFILLILPLACSSQTLPREEIERRAAALAPQVLDFYRSEIDRLGVPKGQEIEIVFTFSAPNESSSKKLASVLELETSHDISMGWFKEPEQGWLVHGKTRLLPAHATIHETEILELARIGVEYNCELRSWRPAPQ